MSFDSLERSEHLGWQTDDALLQFYDELRQLARTLLARESAALTLQATALVHEAYIRIGRQATCRDSSDAACDVAENPVEFSVETTPTWENRAHFFGAAAEAMRRVLVDRARRHSALKRGGMNDRAEVDLESWMTSGAPSEVVMLNDALTELAELHPGKAEIVKLRYFVGLSVVETAQLLDISTATVKRHWAFAKAWLRREMSRLG